MVKTEGSGIEFGSRYNDQTVTWFSVHCIHSLQVIWTRVILCMDQQAVSRSEHR